MKSAMTTETLENENGFDPLIANGGLCLACFNTPWSAPCRLQMSILEALVLYYGNQVTLLNVNIDYLERLRSRFGVHKIPTMIVFNQGVECQRLVGLYPETELRKIIDTQLLSV